MAGVARIGQKKQPNPVISNVHNEMIFCLRDVQHHVNEKYRLGAKRRTPRTQ